MDSLRQQIESEMRQRNDMHRAEIDRLNSRYEDIARRQEDAHKREIDHLQRSFDAQVATLKSSYEAQIAGYQREAMFLERQLTVSQTELAELRVKKERSGIEVLTEMTAVKEALDSLSGGDKSEGSAIERIIGGLASSPLAEGVAARLAGAAGALDATAPYAQVPQPQQAPQQMSSDDLPINTPIPLPDGRVIVRRANGSVVELKRKAAMVPTGEPAPVSDEDIAAVLPFLENALAAERDPHAFAATARNLVPSLSSGPIANLLRAQGVDAFLDRVAKLSPGSPLLMQAGKNWIRETAKALLSED
jgi:hypothetical protein